MRHWKRIAAGICLTGFCMCGIVSWQFHNELQAVGFSMKYSEEEQIAMGKKNEEELQNLLEKSGLKAEEIMIDKEVLDAAENPLKSKNIARDTDTDNKLHEKNSVKKNPVEVIEKTPDRLKDKESDPSMDYDETLAGMVQEIYVLRNSFTLKLDTLLEDAKAEYYSLSPEERKNQKTAIAGKYIRIAGNLEKECDEKMEEILKKMEYHLKETDGDISLVQEILEYYETQKALKKSYYMSKMK